MKMNFETIIANEVINNSYLIDNLNEVVTEIGKDENFFYDNEIDIRKTVNEITTCIGRGLIEKIKNSQLFDSETFINEMETLDSVEETPLSYEDYELEMEQMTERGLRGDI